MPTANKTSPTKPSKEKAPSSTASKLAASLAKLGLRSDMDLVLHLPMRYVDETEITPMKQAAMQGGQMRQVEGLVTACDVQYRPRRQLVVTIA